MAKQNVGTYISRVRDSPRRAGDEAKKTLFHSVRDMFFTATGAEDR